MQVPMLWNLLSNTEKKKWQRAHLGKVMEGWKYWEKGQEIVMSDRELNHQLYRMQQLDAKILCYLYQQGVLPPHYPVPALASIRGYEDFILAYYLTHSILTQERSN